MLVKINLGDGVKWSCFVLRNLYAETGQSNEISFSGYPIPEAVVDLGKSN
jgi:hypothetical protein